MKIVDVAEFYSDQGGGVKTYINSKLEAGAKYGHEVVIIAPGPESGEEKRNGGKIVWVKSPPLPFDNRYYLLWRKKEVFRILDEEKPDIVEGSSPWTGGYFVAKWKGNALKTFIFHVDPVAVYPQTFLGNLMSFRKIDSFFSFFWRYLRKLSNQYDATIVSGKWLARRLEKFNLNNPVSVPFGIDKDFFSPKRRDPELRSQYLNELNLDEDASLFICVSRYHPEKRLSTIIDGFKKISQKHGAGLLIFGDGPLRKWIQQKAKDVNHLKLMGFTSNRDELANAMASSDYYVHGSSAETFGLVVAEAICSGLPIVVPKTGGAVDLSDSSYSEVYKTGDEEDLSRAMEKIIERNYSQLKAACKKAAENKIYSVDEHFQNLFACYEKLLSEKNSSYEDVSSNPVVT